MRPGKDQRPRHEPRHEPRHCTLLCQAATRSAITTGCDRYSQPLAVARASATSSNAAPVAASLARLPV